MVLRPAREMKTMEKIVAYTFQARRKRRGGAVRLR